MPAAAAIALVEAPSKPCAANSASAASSSAVRVTAERALLAELKAGCQTPIAINTELDGEQIQMRALIFDEQDEQAPPKEGRSTGSDPIQIARDLLASLK